MCGNMLIPIDGQVRLGRLVRLQMDSGSFRFFRRKKTDKRQTSVCTMSKR
jgi:hypothetical protein